MPLKSTNCEFFTLYYFLTSCFFYEVISVLLCVFYVSLYKISSFNNYYPFKLKND